MSSKSMLLLAGLVVSTMMAERSAEAEVIFDIELSTEFGPLAGNVYSGQFVVDQFIGSGVEAYRRTPIPGEHRVLSFDVEIEGRQFSEADSLPVSFPYVEFRDGILRNFQFTSGAVLPQLNIGGLGFQLYGFGVRDSSGTIAVSLVPLPAALPLLAAALAGLVGLRSIQRQKLRMPRLGRYGDMA